MSINPLRINYPSLSSGLEEVSRIIGECAAESPEGIRKDLSRIMLKPGKMLRPVFVLLSSSWGTMKKPVPQIAAAVEILHIASLIHDDILDRAVTRRGIKTLHTGIGVKKAVLAGDFLMAKAMTLAAAEYEKTFLPSLTESIERLCRSEIDQDFNCHDMNIGRDRYLERIRGKTAELFGIACLSGAAGSGAPEDICRRLYQAGVFFGLAFQIEDDILDYTGNPGCLGKKIGKDIKAGIPTLPLIEAFKAGDRPVGILCRLQFHRLFPEQIRRMVTKRGYAEEARKTAEGYKRDALSIIEKLPASDGTAVFRKLFECSDSRIS